MSAATRSSDVTKHLMSLSNKRLKRSGGPGSHILESFPNQYPERNYIIQMSFPEFTSLCPVTGQPDFATIILEYIPDDLCVESKSFKLYMFTFRNHQSFMETITNKILDDAVVAFNPRWCRITGLFTPRGGTHIHVFAEHFKKLDNPDKQKQLEQAAHDWKCSAKLRPFAP